jgi:hypothetical protein
VPGGHKKLLKEKRAMTLRNLNKFKLTTKTIGSVARIYLDCRIKVQIEGEACTQEERS